jgi:tryptophanyl-tRNA synthetase
LQAPDQKMSTSAASEAGTVYVLDEPKAVLKKFKSAVTDSGSEIALSPEKPGISSLIEIMAAIAGKQPSEVAHDFAGQQYGALKVAVAEAVIAYLEPVREKYQGLRRDEARLEQILATGAVKARLIARQTLSEVWERMGIGAARR